MNKPEKLATQGTQDEEKQNKNKPEKLATSCTQDEEKLNKTQSRETGNIEYTRRRKTTQKQSRETGNIVYTRRRKTKQNTICVVHHYTQTNNINKTSIRLQTTRGKDEPNTVFTLKSYVCFLFSYWILELLRRCGILFFYWILELLRQRGIFLLFYWIL